MPGMDLFLIEIPIVVKVHGGLSCEKYEGVAIADMASGGHSQLGASLYRSL